MLIKAMLCAPLVLRVVSRVVVCMHRPTLCFKFYASFFFFFFFFACHFVLGMKVK